MPFRDENGKFCSFDTWRRIQQERNVPVPNDVIRHDAMMVARSRVPYVRNDYDGPMPVTDAGKAALARGQEVTWEFYDDYSATMVIFTGNIENVSEERYGWTSTKQTYRTNQPVEIVMTGEWQSKVGRRHYGADRVQPYHKGFTLAMTLDDLARAAYGRNAPSGVDYGRATENQPSLLNLLVSCRNQATYLIQGTSNTVRYYLSGDTMDFEWQYRTFPFLEAADANDRLSLERITIPGMKWTALCPCTACNRKRMVAGVNQMLYRLVPDSAGIEGTGVIAS